MSRMSLTVTVDVHIGAILGVLLIFINYMLSQFILRVICGCVYPLSNHFKPSGVKWLHFKVFNQGHTGLTHPLIFDIRALCHSGLSARVPDCQKLKRVG